ncbi:hypothetical protein JI58_01645 [Marinosulfonomonas sp. PRT-SC04]|nr:hypothetical protein JI58_01645 [Marinosulfonomonas sp. PRT-SC04]
MQGWKIFIHSVRTVFGNLGPALRISGFLYAAYILSNAYYVLTYSDDLVSIQQSMAAGIVPQELPSGLFPSMMLNFAIGLMSSLWIAVLWHRFVLLAEVPETVIPPFLTGMISAYLGKTIQLALMLMVFGVLLGMLLGVALGPLLGGFAGAAIPLILLGVLLYLSYRLGLVFPAVALKTPISFKTSWEKTQSASGAIAQLAVIAVVFALLIQIPSNMNPDPTSLINLIYSYVVGWIAMMVGISVLTTLYGVYIEGREL